MDLVDFIEKFKTAFLVILAIAIIINGIRKIIRNRRR